LPVAPLTQPEETEPELENKDKCALIMTRNIPNHREDWNDAAEIFRPLNYSNIDKLKHSEISAHQKEVFDQLKNETKRREAARLATIRLAQLLKKQLSLKIKSMFGKGKTVENKTVHRGRYEKLYLMLKEANNDPEFKLPADFPGIDEG